MASETAKAVAQDVIAARKKGGRIIMGKIVEKRGYAKSIITHPRRVTKTKSFQKEIKPFLDRLIGLRNKIITAMESRDISQERFTELGRTLQGITHDIQLISGGATETINWKPFDELPTNNSIQEDKSTNEKNTNSSGREFCGEDDRDNDVFDKSCSA